MKKLFNIFSIVVAIFISIGLFSSCKKTALDIPANLNGASDTTSVPDSSWIGLIAWYPLNTSGFDFSGTGAGTASVHNISSTIDRFGNPDAAFYFDGATSYLKIKHNHVLNLDSADFTITVWMKMDSYGGPNGSALISKRGPGPANGWFFSVNNTPVNNSFAKPGLLNFAPGSTDLFGIDTTALALNRWYMVTTMYNSTKKQCSLYINGVLNSVTNNIVAPSSSSIADMYIGRDNISNASESYYFKGSMDDIKIYNRMLTVSELKKALAHTD
jgi:hypothetical protein